MRKWSDNGINDALTLPLLKEREAEGEVVNLQSKILHCK